MDTECPTLRINILLGILSPSEFCESLPQNEGNNNSETLDLKIFWENMPPYPAREFSLYLT